METPVRIISTKDFLVSSHAGELDIGRSKQILRALAGANRPPADRHILVDLRESRSDPIQMSQVVELVKVMVDHLASFQNKLALLISPDAPRERSTLLKQLADRRGFNLEVFTDPDAAMSCHTPPGPGTPRFTVH